MPFRSAKSALAAAFLLLLVAPGARAETLQHLPGFAAVARKVLPGVVDVVVERTSPLDEDEDGPDESSPDEGRLAPQDGGIDAPAAELQNGPDDELGAEGSGFLIDPAGYIVTSAHVIEGARSIRVSLRDGSAYPARLVGSDTVSDLALLKVDAGHPLPALVWGDSDAVAVGDWVLAAGSPFGLGGSVSAGILSARDRILESGGEDLLQIDAPLNRGNSGGPTLNDMGDVIGVNTAIYTPSGGSVGIGFAIPSNAARPVIEELRERGRVVRGWLGVALQDITPDLARALGLDTAAGALVADVTPGGPADRAGLRHGDVILSFDGQAINSARGLGQAVTAASPGSRATIGVWRDGRDIGLSARVAARPQPGAPPSVVPEEAVTTTMGLTLALVGDTLRREFGIPQNVAGVIVLGVAADSPFAGSGLERGDVIEEIDRWTVTSLPLAAARLKEAASEPGPRPTLLLLDRGGEKRYLALALNATGSYE